MISDFMNILMPYIGDLLYILTVVFLGTLSLYLKERYGLEKIKKMKAKSESLQEIVELTVLYVQQIGREMKGEEKFNLALQTIAGIARDRGINVSVSDLEVMIEATVKMMKKAFGDFWKEL